MRPPMTEANKLLDQAAKARRLMLATSDPKTLDALEQYARECEQTARAMGAQDPDIDPG